MIALKLVLYLSIGTVVMLIPIVIQTKQYGIKLWKSAPIAVSLTIVGTIGTYILFFIENQWIGGTSFYGAVFLVPILFPFVAKLLREKTSYLLDISAPAECAMLMIMKIQCQLSGCCGGRELFLPGMQQSIQFPSQIAEMINAVFICFVLLLLSANRKNQGAIYPWYMVIYGASRFFLNVFREAWVTKQMLLPFGNIWSLVAIGVGIAWLLIQKRKQIV